MPKPSVFSCIRPYITTAVKYIFSLVLIFLSYRTMRSLRLNAVLLLEWAAIVMVCHLICMKSRIIGNIINDLLLLIFHVECLSLYFGGSFVSLLMITNIDSLEALSGKLPIYIAGSVILLIVTLLPIRAFPIKLPASYRLLSGALVLELAFTLFFGNGLSPLFSTVTLAQQYHASRALAAAINSSENITARFKMEPRDFYQKPENLPDKPNVIVIFTEGLSENIVHDERGIMPNVRNYESQALSFSNYYNHTFATYRALSGTLYSGYQLNNYDPNTLLGMQDILKANGYHTSMINTEPYNPNFTGYLEDMDFDEVISDFDASSQEEKISYITDKDAYSLLFDTAMEQSKTGQPFFTAIYTFETHVGMNPKDETFGDGKSAFLNKFYNCDFQFGKFMDEFNKSSLADNTIVVFTADHATYADEDFIQTFPDYPRAHTNIDSIPFFIYYKGITPEVRDVRGQNSLDLAPTVLDYIDIEGRETYFLGSSLFYGKDNGNNYDTVYYDTAALLSTDQCEIKELGENQQIAIMELITQYFTAKTQTPQ